MSVDLIELRTSRSFSTSLISASGKWEYLARATGESDPEAAVEAAVDADAPFYWEGMAKKEIKAEPIGGGLYACGVDYSWEMANTAAQDPTQSPGPTDGPGGGPPSGTPSGPATADTPLGPNVSLEIGGRPPKLYSSRFVAHAEAIVGLAPNNDRLLNVNRRTGEVEGLEIDDPATTFVLEYTFDFCTMRYIDRLRNAVWSVNDAEWRHIPAGDVVFMGASLSTTDNGRGRISFRFGLGKRETIESGVLRGEMTSASGSPEEDALPADDVVKGGWQYLEIVTRPEFDPTSGLVVERPWAMYIHDILPEFDFTLFGIGG